MAALSVRVFSKLGALLVAFIVLFGCARVRDTQRERPDLGIAEDKASQRALISLRQVRVSNKASVAGEGIMSIAVVDSLGATLMEVPLQAGAPIGVPAASLGGSEGRVVPVSGGAAFENLLDSLLRSELPFGLRARIRTIGDDAQEADNVATREWRVKAPLTPGTEMTIRFAFAVSRRVRARIETRSLSDGIRIVDSPEPPALVIAPGTHAMEIHLASPLNLRHGSAFIARLALTDYETGEVIQQHERIAVFDTVLPMVSSYRAVLLRDGRIAIQVQVGDRDSGVLENAVATEYSRDHGKTWQRRVHASVHDDFGRPVIFETVLDSVTAGTDLLVGISARDMVGNINRILPDDAAVFKAPVNAESILDEFGFASPNGNPIFGPTTVARHAAWVAAETARARVLARQPQADLDVNERFELERFEDISAVPAEFQVRGVDISGFDRTGTRLLRLSDHGSERTVLRIRTSRR